LARTSNRKYRPSDKQKPDATVAKANERLVSRFHQLKTGHYLTGQNLAWTTRRTPPTGGVSTRFRLGSTSSRIAPSGRASRRLFGQPSSKRPARSPPPRGRDRTSIAELLADERRSQAVLEFLATTDVGRISGPPVADEDASSEALEWEEREQAERAWDRREEEERLGRDW